MFPPKTNQICLGCTHLSRIAVVTSNQTNWTKGDNQPESDSIELNNAGLETHFK